MRFGCTGWTLLLIAVSLFAENGGGISKISPVIYQNIYLKSFLADYLVLTEAQMVQTDLVFAEARARMFPLNEKLHEALDAVLSNGMPAVQWKPLVTTIATTQAQMLAIECAALERFRNLLDGDQRHKLGKLSLLSMAKNEQGEPVVSYSVEQ